MKKSQVRKAKVKAIGLLAGAVLVLLVLSLVIASLGNDNEEALEDTEPAIVEDSSANSQDSFSDPIILSATRNDTTNVTNKTATKKRSSGGGGGGGGGGGSPAPAETPQENNEPQDAQNDTETDDDSDSDDDQDEEDDDDSGNFSWHPTIGTGIG
jgi:hypothetical protein